VSCSPVVLIVEGDIVIRHPLAEYLRECGFTVFEAANGEEAKAALNAPELHIEIVLVDMATAANGFALRQWILKHKPSVEVMLAGSVQKAVAGAAEVCQDGPAITKPYDHRLLLDRIRQSLARRESAKPRL
jgi:DNA-binding response OmpR family regulator